jgi:hypothetical protein
MDAGWSGGLNGGSTMSLKADILALPGGDEAEVTTALLAWAIARDAYEQNPGKECGKAFIIASERIARRAKKLGIHGTPREVIRGLVRWAQAAGK